PACGSVANQSCVGPDRCGSGTNGTLVRGFTCETGRVCCNTVINNGNPQGNNGNPQGSNAGNPQPISSQVITFSNPLQFNTVEEVLTALLGALQAIIVILSIIFIVIGAIMYITSAGDEGRMKTAKGSITAAMIGLALGIAAPSFLKEIGTILGWSGVSSGAVGAARTLTAIATDVLNFLLSIVGILGMIMLVVGGIMYLTAAGDENRMETGKKVVTYSIIGIVVALISLIVVTQIASFFA
ncbi:MAG: pilin, partial [Candidatus Moranbacteria bacterium]|nr:pilin [Candidatus Moranbacteria bacterium]